MNRNNSTERGFTLMEVLVAMVILGIIGSSAMYAVRSQSGMGTRNSESMSAFASSKQKLDSLKVTSYNSLTSGSDTAAQKYIRAWSVTANRDGLGALNGRKTITLTTYWPYTGENRVSLATIISDERYKENP